MPQVKTTGVAAGRLRGSDTVLAAGAVDAVCEQIVAGADEDGDVLVLCGTTLIVWVTTSEFREVPGLWTLPHTAAGKLQIGGPSNAGGLFLGWVDRLVTPNGDVDPGGCRCGRRTCAVNASRCTIPIAAACSTGWTSPTTAQRCDGPPARRRDSLCGRSSR